MTREKIRNLAPAGLLLAFFLLSLLSARGLDLTYDEPKHYQYGMQILELNSNRFDDSKMPFSAINALPGWLSKWMPAGNLKMFFSDIQAGRAATMLFGVLLGFFVFLWSKELYGFLPGLFSLFLYAFDPNLLANSQLVTTDLYAAGMLLLSAYAAWRFSIHRDWGHAALLGLVVGLAQLSKYTCIALYPLLAALLLLRDAPTWLGWITRRDFHNLGIYLRRMALFAALVAALGLLVINIGFLFNHTLTPLKDYRFKSDAFGLKQLSSSPLGWLPAPTPYPYLEGLDWVRYNERSGKNYGNLYLMGQLSKQGFTGYYFIAFLYKTPIAAQLAILFSAIVYLPRRKSHRFLQNELFLLGPVLFYAIFFNFFYRAQIGIRYFLVVFPFLYVFCGSLLSGWHATRPVARAAGWALVGVLWIYLAASTLSYYPTFLPYFNELLPDRRLAYQVLADSNLDWGEMSGYLEKYRQQHPEAVIDPQTPTAGLIVVSPNSLVGITAKPETYAWLREHFTPVDTIAHTLLVYLITPEQLAKIK